VNIKKKIILGIIVIAILGFAYYAISPLFRNKEVHDALPEAVVKTTPDPLDNTDSMPADLEREVEIIDIGNSDGGNTEEKELVSESPREETPIPVETKSARVLGTSGHPAEGTARVIETTEGIIVRFENFKTINGPNLHVYLSKDLEAKDFVDLGPIRGTSGNINYTVPNDINITEYKYVLHWCVPFRVLFNSAEIN